MCKHIKKGKNRGNGLLLLKIYTSEDIEKIKKKLFFWRALSVSLNNLLSFRHTELPMCILFVCCYNSMTHCRM